jgi:hypothetical protein
MKSKILLKIICIGLLIVIFNNQCEMDSPPDGNPSDGSYNVPTIAPFSTALLNPLETYYVDKSGVDTNPGTETSPWLTISHAAESIPPGSKVIVKAGNYDERIRIDSGGTETNYNTFEAQGVVTTRGFQINADYVAVMGFTIKSTQSLSGWLGGGFWVNASNIYIYKNSMYDLVDATGIQTNWSADSHVDSIYLIDNYIYGCNKGIDFQGTYWLVEGNEIEHLYRTAAGYDADYIRFFGENIIIRKNYMHGTQEADILDSHTDLFQTFPNNNSIAKNVLIEQNMGTDFFHQGIMAEGLNGSHKNIIVRGNVFTTIQDGGSWAICSEGLLELHVINNTFYNFTIHGVGFRAGSTGSVQNNIIVNTNSSYWKEESSSYFSCNNLIYNSPDPDPGAESDILDQDPLFINPDNIVGADGIPFTDDDGLRINENSPAWKAGSDGDNIGAY